MYFRPRCCSTVSLIARERDRETYQYLVEEELGEFLLDGALAEEDGEVGSHVFRHQVSGFVSRDDL